MKKMLEFQSTLPRRERLQRREMVVCRLQISIHAPAKGATSHLVRSCKALVISIHAPAKGATWSFASSLSSTVISIHAPAKGATTIHIISVNKSIISIHAPAKGATAISQSDSSLDSVFQSTLPRRERHKANHPNTKHYCISIHAPAKGATQGKPSEYKALLYFNPRSREGSDITRS